MDKNEFVKRFSKNNPQKSNKLLIKNCMTTINGYFGNLSILLSENGTDPNSYQLYQYNSRDLFFKTPSLKLQFESKGESVEVKKNDELYDSYYPKNDSVYSEKYNEEITSDFFNRYLPLFMN